MEFSRGDICSLLEKLDKMGFGMRLQGAFCSCLSEPNLQASLRAWRMGTAWDATLQSAGTLCLDRSWGEQKRVCEEQLPLPPKPSSQEKRASSCQTAQLVKESSLPLSCESWQVLERKQLPLPTHSQEGGSAGEQFLCHGCREVGRGIFPYRHPLIEYPVFALCVLSFLLISMTCGRLIFMGESMPHVKNTWGWLRQLVSYLGFALF